MSPIGDPHGGMPARLRPSTSATKRLVRLFETLKGRKRLLILTHDNPDPDSIAAGWGLLKVVRRIGRLEADLAYGGVIGRGENRTLVRVLKVPLQPLSEVDAAAYDGFALVDSQPETGNNSLPPGVQPIVVIDHHPCRPITRTVPYFDIREDYGATATIVSEYLAAAEVPLDRLLATAFFYAIKAETQNLGRDSSRADVRAFLSFFPRVDNAALSRIEHPRIPRAYFSMMGQLIEGTRIHDRVAVTLLGNVSHPDVVAEFADLMVRMERIEWALTIGRFGPDILLSIRTNRQNANAGRVIQEIVGKEGKAGGHGMMAGGKISAGSLSDERAEEVERLLSERALRVLHAPPGSDGLI